MRHKQDKWYGYDLTEKFMMPIRNHPQISMPGFYEQYRYYPHKDASQIVLDLSI